MKKTPRRKCIGVIPARYGSTRFPGKPLADVVGKPMIQRVYERCVLASSLDDVVVATDDRRIYEACAAFGARVYMTAAEHPSAVSYTHLTLPTIYSV